MTTVIEQAWDQVATKTDDAGAIRVDATHPADFFAAQDPSGRLGLVLVLDVPPPDPPRLESVDVQVGERADGRWGLSIWLTTGMLRAPFAQLCEDLIESSRAVPSVDVGTYVVSRLNRWQELLEAAGVGMGVSKLRGLVGELLFFRDALDVLALADVVRGWAGPYRAPQDFALPGFWLEVKATFPTARTVRISSVDQLTAPGRLVLVVYTLASLLPHDEGVTAGRLVSDIETRIASSGEHELLGEFDRRLSAVGFDRTADYAAMPFREDAVHFYDVGPDFPRIARSDLMPGVAQVSYDVDIGALPPFETQSPLRVPDGSR